MTQKTIAVLNEKSIDSFKKLFPSYEIRIANDADKRHFEYHFKKRLDHGVQVPHIGYYLIKNIYKEKPNWNEHIEEYFGEVLWKEKIEDLFFDGCIEHIRLKPLFNKYSSGHPLATITDLAGEVIYIESVELIDEGGYKTYKVIWSILDEECGQLDFPQDIENTGISWEELGRDEMQSLNEDFQGWDWNVD